MRGIMRILDSMGKRKREPLMLVAERIDLDREVVKVTASF